MSQLLTLQPRDPLIARDGRPFGDNSGSRMRSLDWPLPPTVAGSLRTLLGCALGGNFDAQLIQRLKNLACHGPLPMSDATLLLPAAHDALVGQSGDCVTLRPEEIRSGGLDLPDGLLPVLPPSPVSLMKFDWPPAWWSLEKMIEWLLTPDDAPSAFFQRSSAFRQSPKRDERIHVQIDPRTFAAKPQLLFSSAGLVLDDLVEPGGKMSHHTELVVRVDAGSDQAFHQELQTLNGFQTLGGERRVVRVQLSNAADQSRFDCPPALQQALAQPKAGDGVRMVLATPAIFEHGWRPGWLNEAGGRVGIPPGLGPAQIKLRLIAVGNQRWEAVSGWSYESHGPKPVKRMVPAGGVYFFQIESVSAGALSQLWLQPVSDDDQDRRDGFGLAVWGLWNRR